MTMPPRTIAGFTLPELILVLFVLGILVALVSPPLARSERRWAAYTAARTLGADVARARRLAIQQRAAVRVVLDTLGGTYAVRVAPCDTVIRRKLRPDLLLGTSAHLQEILFSARGTSNLYSTAWIVARADPGAHEHRIRVLPTGAIEFP
jgi:prepilin-type N-terminal cleavage/methylation domain-containing protein